MCGSGTFLIEAALIAANINPGIYRKQFAFEKWPDFDRELFEDIYNDDSAERDFNFKIYGGDIDPEAVNIARKNVREAKVEDMIEISCRPMSEWTENPEPGIIVMNPPYGERLKSDDMVALFKGIGTCLKKNFAGWTAWLIGPDNEDFGNIGLKPTLKIPLLNGSLECSLREYVLFDGRYDEFRADGGSLGKLADEEMERERPRKMKRVSDDEWKKETRKFGNHDRKGGKPKAGNRKFSDERSRKFAGESGFDGQEFSSPRDFHGPKKFDHSDRKPFRKDGDRPFRKDGDFRRGSNRAEGASPKAGFRKDDRKPFRKDGDRPFRKDGDLPFRNDRWSKPVDTNTGKGPSIPESNEYKFSEYRLRSRRPKPSDDE